MRSTLIVGVAGLAALSSAMPTTTAPPHHTPTYGPTSSVNAHSTSGAYSKPTHGPKPGDLVFSFWSYLTAHVPRPTHKDHPYGTHTKSGYKPRPTPCIYNHADGRVCMIPRPHHVIPMYTYSSVSRSGHGTYGSVSTSFHAPKTVRLGPYPISNSTHKPHSPKETSSSLYRSGHGSYGPASTSFHAPKTFRLGPYPISNSTHKPHPPKQTWSPAPHTSYVPRGSLDVEEKPPCRPGNPWCGYHPHPTYLPTGHSTTSYAPTRTPETPSPAVVNSTHSSNSHHPLKFPSSHTSNYAPKHTPKPIDPPPKVPIDLLCAVEAIDRPECVRYSHSGPNPTSTKEHVPSYPTVTSSRS